VTRLVFLVSIAFLESWNLNDDGTRFGDKKLDFVYTQYFWRLLVV
jgi:hypothetical protein